MALCTCWPETANTSGTHEITTGFQWGSIFSFWRPLFVLFLLIIVLSIINLRLIIDMDTFKTKVSVFFVNLCWFIMGIHGLLPFLYHESNMLNDVTTNLYGLRFLRLDDEWQRSWLGAHSSTVGSPQMVSHKTEQCYCVSSQPPPCFSLP